MNATNRVMLRAQGVATRVLVSSDNRRVIAAAVLVGVLTLVVKVTTLLREVLVAAKLGTSDSMEAYLAAWAIPGFLSLIMSDAIVGSLLPLHARAREERGEVAAQQVFAETLLIGILLLLAVTAVLAMLPQVLLPILASNFDAEKLALTSWLWSIMLPAVFINGLAAIWTGMLHAGNRFGLAALGPVAAPIASGIGLLVFPGRAVDALAVGFVIGNLIYLSLLGRELRRHRVRLTPGWFGGLPETRGLFRDFFPLLGNGIVFGGLPLVDTAMAATLGDRQLAVLNYGNKLVLPILGISSAALGTVVFPYFSRLVAERKWDGLQRTLSVYTRLILAATIPLTIVLVLLSEVVVRLLFQRGEFTAADTAEVARVQATLSLMIPCYTLGVVYSRVIISLGKSHLMLLSSMLVFVLNLVCDLLFKELIGIQGIALATVINYAVQLTILYLIGQRLLRDRIAGQDRY
ncbi:MAG: putative peptidoglycan lipid flippase [Thermomicrobiales bacterium]|nr:putative peptidoglycan lipid flippase [Thermomicrobiales bacterium]MEA2596464.1 putative peptidoglycan lipid flippase [Thermomicrobiales bacterium]